MGIINPSEGASPPTLFDPLVGFGYPDPIEPDAWTSKSGYYIVSGKQCYINISAVALSLTPVTTGSIVIENLPFPEQVGNSFILNATVGLRDAGNTYSLTCTLANGAILISNSIDENDTPMGFDNINGIFILNVSGVYITE